MYESQDQVKRYVFRSRRNLSGPTAGSRRLSGSEFQTVGPATAKARAVIGPDIWYVTEKRPKFSSRKLSGNPDPYFVEKPNSGHLGVTAGIATCIIFFSRCLRCTATLPAFFPAHDEDVIIVHGEFRPEFRNPAILLYSM